MRFRPITLAILTVLLLGGLISTIYAQAIERDLTLPTAHKMDPLPVLPPPSPLAPTATLQGEGQGQVMLLARDTFQRTNQAFWGTAVDGQQWAGDANTSTLFSITSGFGQIVGGQGTFSAILGPTASAIDVLVSATASTFNGGKVSIGAVVRWNDTNNWYKAQIDGSHLSIIKHIHSIGRTLATLPFDAHTGMVYTLRMRAQGSTLSAKVWPATTTEPANWTLVASDTSLDTGRGGVRIVVQNMIVVRVRSFLETATKPSV